MSDYMSELVKEKIKSIKEEKNVFETGRVLRIHDYILEVTGLENAAFFEMVNIGKKAVGYINSIRKDSVIVSIVKQYDHIFINDEVQTTGKEFMGEYSPDSVGHIVDIFGVDLFNGQKFENCIPVEVQTKNIPIMDRTDLKRPLLTGITGIDLLYPIGRGQRQLIIGDKKTGKTQIGLDAIVNQRGKNTLCIYVSIGKTKKNVKEVYMQLAKHNALNYTIMLAASNDDKSTVLCVTPYIALSIAKEYMLKGVDVLVVIDDLKRHADVYRETSLLTGKEPGRDAYPSDIFYAHSRMLEIGCQHKNGASITILPIVETRGGDITDYISTNIISITDGQIVLSKKNFDKGLKPAIDYGLSVSRLGGSVQEKDVRKVGAKVRRDLLSYLETKEIYELANIDEMGVELQTKLKNGQLMLKELSQYKFASIEPSVMIKTFTDIIGGSHEQS